MMFGNHLRYRATPWRSRCATRTVFTARNSTVRSASRASNRLGAYSVSHSRQCDQSGCVVGHPNDSLRAWGSRTKGELLTLPEFLALEAR